MRPDFRIFLYALAANAAVVIVYGLVQHFSPKRSSAVKAKCILMLLLPGMGPLMLLCSRLFCRLFFHDAVDLSKVLFSTRRKKFLMKASEEQERNMVPLEEAMSVGEKTETRALVMDVISRNMNQTLPAISLTLDSNDSEVAHYAASVMQDVLGSFRGNYQKMSETIFSNEQKILPLDDPAKGKIFITKKRQAFEAAEKQKKKDGQPFITLTRESFTSPLVLAGLADPEGSGSAEDKEPAGSEALCAAQSAAKDAAQGEANSAGKEAARKDAKASAAEESSKKDSKKDGDTGNGEVGETSTAEGTDFWKTPEERLEEEMSTAVELISALRAMLSQHMLTDLEQETYTDKLALFLDLIYFRDVPDVNSLEKVIMQLLDGKRVSIAEKWVGVMRKLYPAELATYRCRLRLAYSEWDHDAFRAVMDELKHSGVVFDTNMMNLVRLFDEGSGS